MIWAAGMVLGSLAIDAFVGCVLYVAWRWLVRPALTTWLNGVIDARIAAREKPVSDVPARVVLRRVA